MCAKSLRLKKNTSAIKDEIIFDSYGTEFARYNLAVDKLIVLLQS